jgi:eukaryotic-like serine/threonine-protein kinase
VNSPVQPGQILAEKYRVERVIGAGGMGVVVAATHLELGQRVAMKFLLAEGVGRPEIAARFIREARAAARIRGEHVARVIDVGRLESGSPYIVMEYLEGNDLEHIVREGPLSIEDAVDYLIQACDAMAEAHHLGIIHRDLKPANLFRAETVDGLGIIKVLDFGISKSLLDTGPGLLTGTSALLGSPLYMSPEQMRSARDVDHRTDIWSLGAVLFELLSGRPPYDGDSVGSLMAKILVDKAPSVREFRPDVPEGLAQVIMRCLEKDVNVRFGDVAELSLALTPFAPRRSMLAVERVHRILGSVPPPAEILSPVPSRSSLTPGAHGGTPFPSPESLAEPRVPRIEEGDGRKSFAPASTAPRVGHATTSGWGGIDAQKVSGKAPRLALLVGLPTAALLVAAYLIFGQKPVDPPATEAAPPTPSAVVAPASSPPQAAPPAPMVTVSAAIPPEPPASAAPSASVVHPVPTARRVVKAPPAEAKPAETSSSETRPRDSRLRMDLKK